MNLKNDFYVYEWYNIKNNMVFYVGKGRKDRAKSTRNRNKLFMEYIQNNEVAVRIVYKNLTEDKAFELEKEATEYYKALGQCQCNLAKAGTGGLSSVWTPEFKEYWSKYNPMKDEKQRERMRKNNPSFNKETALKSGEAKKRAVILDGIYYKGLVDAAKILGVRTETITKWCKRGYNTQGKPCRYANEEQKQYTIPPKGKPVIIDDKYYYSTVKEAALALGSRDSSSLCKALKTNKLFKGHKCEYANQQPSQ